MNFKFLIPCACLFLVIFACTQDKLPEPQPKECSDVPTYRGLIKPIIDGSCALSGCHDSSGAAPGNYSTYDGVFPRLENGQFKEQVIDKREMPLFPGELTNEQRKLIECWLENDYPE